MITSSSQTAKLKIPAYGRSGPLHISMKTLQNRKIYKTHPHILLSEYDIAIWIDANIMIINDFHDIVDNFISSDLLLGAIPHPNRNSIYEEISACRKRNKDNLKIMELQVTKYKSENFFMTT